METSDSFHVLHLQFFPHQQTVDFMFVWGDQGTSWKSVRKYLFGRYKIKTDAEEKTTAARFILCAGDEHKCSKKSSNFIRGSETLAHEKAYELDRGVHLLTEPRGFSCYSNDAKAVNLMLSSKHDLNQFERFAMLFALGLAYREVLLETIGQMGNALTELDQQDSDAAQTYTSLAKLRESVVLFDARHFFHAPVRPERQELFVVVQQFMRVLHIQPLHQEMADQLGEVSRLADHKLEAIQQAHRETLLVHQQQAAVRHERKMGKLNVMLAIQGWFALL